MSAESCGKQSRFYEQGDRGELWPWQPHPYVKLSRENDRVSEYERRGKWTEIVCRGTVQFFSQVWERNGSASEAEWQRRKVRPRVGLWRVALHPACAVTVSRAPFLSQSPPQPVTDDTAPVGRIWETVSRNTVTSGQTCPGPRLSPCLPPLSPPRPSSRPGYTVEHSSLSLSISLLASQQHIAPSLSDEPSLFSLSIPLPPLYFSLAQCGVIENPSFCRERVL